MDQTENFIEAQENQSGLPKLNSDLIHGFVQSLLAKKFDGASQIPDFHREWWDLCCSEDLFIAISAPRSHAKSTAITFSYTLAAVLFRQHSFVVICSGTQATSILFLQEIKNEIMDNTELQSLFGVKKDDEGKVLFEKDSEDDIIVAFDDGYRFRIIAKGAEQKVRGIKWDSKRPDLLIGDDLEDDEQVLNKERREKFRKWFYGAFIPCKALHGKVIIVGTILHLDSLLERLMPAEKAKTTEYTDLRTTSTRKSGMWKAIKYRAHNPDFTKILWKSRYDKEWFQEKYEEYCSQGIPDVYSQEFLNEPLDESNALFKRSDFLPIQKDEKDVKLHYYIAADLAISEKQRSDYTVFAVGGLDENGLLHVKNVVRARLDGMAIVDTILTLQKIYKPEIFALEEGTISKSIGPFLREQMLKTGVFPNLHLLKPSTDKISRSRSIQARMRAGAVKFDKSSEWYPLLEEEMCRFPRDKHDDQVDAMAYLGLIVDKMIDAPTKQEEEQEDYEEDLYESGLTFDGQNPICGY